MSLAVARLDEGLCTAVMLEKNTSNIAEERDEGAEQPREINRRIVVPNFKAVVCCRSLRLLNGLHLEV